MFTRYSILFSLFVVLAACNMNDRNKEVEERFKRMQDSTRFSLEQANRLADLPLDCIGQQYPNKPSMVLESDSSFTTPKLEHPAFYGCFDWHSAVHGHWSLVKLLKSLPEIEHAETIRYRLKTSLSAENIKEELVYFEKEINKSYERTYGWAWLLKLDLELLTWDDSLAREIRANLQPLTKHIVEKYLDFLPKLNYPERVGKHSNTAFGLNFAFDYALAVDNVELKKVIMDRAKYFYMDDIAKSACPLSWEPSGSDFLSPCLEEAALMQRILPQAEFKSWLKKFLPDLFKKDFTMAVGEVSDRTDGQLVHLDGLNFSRAWNLQKLAQLKELKHLNLIAREHIAYSLPNLVGDDYMGGHWLASFAIYALEGDLEN